MAAQRRQVLLTVIARCSDQAYLCVLHLYCPQATAPLRERGWLRRAFEVWRESSTVARYSSRSFLFASNRMSVCLFVLLSVLGVRQQEQKPGAGRGWVERKWYPADDACCCPGRSGQSPRRRDKRGTKCRRG